MTWSWCWTSECTLAVMVDASWSVVLWKELTICRSWPKRVSRASCSRIFLFFNWASNWRISRRECIKVQWCDWSQFSPYLPSPNASFSSTLLTISGCKVYGRLLINPSKLQQLWKVNLQPILQVDLDLWPCGSLHEHCHDCRKNNCRVSLIVRWPGLQLQSFMTARLQRGLSWGLLVMCLMPSLSPKHCTVFQTLPQGIGNSWIYTNLTKCLAWIICCGFSAQTKKVQSREAVDLCQNTGNVPLAKISPEYSEIIIGPEKQGNAPYSKSHWKPPFPVQEHCVWVLLSEVDYDLSSQAEQQQKKSLSKGSQGNYSKWKRFPLLWNQSWCCRCSINGQLETSISRNSWETYAPPLRSSTLRSRPNIPKLKSCSTDILFPCFSKPLLPFPGLGAKSLGNRRAVKTTYILACLVWRCRWSAGTLTGSSFQKQVELYFERPPEMRSAWAPVRYRWLPERWCR